MGGWCAIRREKWVHETHRTRKCLSGNIKTVVEGGRWIAKGVTTHTRATCADRRRNRLAGLGGYLDATQRVKVFHAHRWQHSRKTMYYSYSTTRDSETPGHAHEVADEPSQQ
ncbi:unnamed protein product [Ectocarpus sp. 12 AP-2014]